MRTALTTRITRTLLAALAAVIFTSRTAAAVVTSFGNGTLIIPMDTGTNGQNNGMLRAYGLVYDLLRHGVPVSWTIDPAKPANGNDFTVSVANALEDVRTGATVASPRSYRGGPFLIAAADAATALPLIQSWQATVGDQTAVHRLVGASSINPDVSRVLVSAPSIAILKDGNETIAFNDLNAAGIPDASGGVWTASSLGALTETAIEGPTTTVDDDGALFDAGTGLPRYCFLASMHYNATLHTDEVVQETRQWLDRSDRGHAFMQCEAARVFENANGGLFLTNGGIDDDGAATATPTIRVPASPLAQLDGTFQVDSGSVDSIAPKPGGFKTGVTTLINENSATLLQRIVMLTGRLDGDAANGQVTYLGGHDYALDLPITSNPQTNGVRLFLNALLSSDCALFPPPNAAPVLDDTKSPTLANVAAESPLPIGPVGTLVAQLVDLAVPAGQLDNVDDSDGPALGIAVIAADTADGDWYYSLDGSVWQPLGSVTPGAARLLGADATTRLYFRPHPGFSGAIADAITFRAWDGSSGAGGAIADTSPNGGTTAFSTATDTASIAVTVDADHDGYDASVDCDDTNAAINPGADEVCDAASTDENCDGLADDDPGAGAVDRTLQYVDQDGDGHGAIATSLTPRCHGAAVADDCEDTNPAIHPGVVEVCDPNDVDEDCNGLADDADPGAAAKALYFTDADGDGFGTGPGTLRCDPGGTETATNHDDCDDGNSSVHPYATEVVANGIDEDCNGYELCFVDADHDGARLTDTVVSADPDCTDPGEADATAPIDCDDLHAAAHPGGTEVCDPDDVDEDCDGAADDADPDATGKTLFYADADGDGYGSGTGVERCGPSPAFPASVDGDCNDAHASMHPGTAEICRDDIDNDCNGAIDCADPICNGDLACGPSLCANGPFTCKSPGSTQFDLRNATKNDRDKLAFRWTLGDPTTTAELGDPTVATSYAVCVWDDVAGTPTLVMEAKAPPAGNCVGRPCWRPLGSDGFRYRDPGRLPNGLDQITLRSGPLGRASVSVRGRGVWLPDPPMPFQQAPHVTVQVVNSLGNCWGVEFVNPARKNTADHLLLKEKP